jgi:integrase/recombinase XerD
MKTNPVAIASIIHETRVLLKDGSNPVKLRVTYNRRSKYYILKYPKLETIDFAELFGKTINLTTDDYNEIVPKSNYISPGITKPAKWYKTHKAIFASIQSKANDCIAKIKPFSFELFEEIYFERPKDDQDIIGALKFKEGKLKEAGKISTGITYQCTRNSLIGYVGGEKFPFRRVTVPFLEKYESHLRDKVVGKAKRPMSDTTISLYMRCIRSIFTDHAPEGTPNPFKGRGHYSIPSWNETRRALSMEDIGKIAAYKAPEGSIDQRSRDFWLFSYLCNGINFKDVANLKYANIRGDMIVFERAKTARKSKRHQEIQVVITRQIGRIIDRWGTGGEYIFPILNSDMSPDTQYKEVAKFIQTTNKHMKRICDVLEIPLATTYAARHSFATVLKRSGASIEFISESLGHRDIGTTQNYLGKFETEEKKKWAMKLLPDIDN